MEAQNYCQYDEQERRTRKRETGGTFSPTTKKRAELRAICWESAFYSRTDCIVHNHRLSKTIISSCHYSLTIRARNVQVYTNKRRSRERKDCQRIIRPSSSSSPIERYIEQHRRFTVIFYRPWRPALNVKARFSSGGRQDLYPRGESNALLPGDIYSGLWRNLFTASLRRSKVLFRKFFFESFQIVRVFVSTWDCKKTSRLRNLVWIPLCPLPFYVQSFSRGELLYVDRSERRNFAYPRARSLSEVVPLDLTARQALHSSEDKTYSIVTQ